VQFWRLVQVLMVAVALQVIGPTPLSATVQIQLSQQHIKRGETIRVDVISEYPLIQKKIVFAGRSFMLFEDQANRSTESGYQYRSYVAASRYLKSGTQFLKLFYQPKGLVKTSQMIPIEIDHPPAVKGRVNLSKKKNKLSQNRYMTNAEATLLSKQIKRRTAVSHMSGVFIMPAKGRMSSGFGVNRSYNGQYQRSHAGVDIANKRRTRVTAPNRGKVVLSQKLAVHGNTVMIDHGFGVVSIYNHLHRRKVKEGDMVTQGDIIGSIGDTGVATGPHLHWGLSIQNVRVDPLYWVDNPILMGNSGGV
jgi:lysostaphin